MNQPRSRRFINLMNKDWQFRQAGKSNWYPANVPGCVHLDLLNNDLIEDPFYRDNETRVQWIENEDWEYRLVFDVSSDILKKKHIQLNFEGLDTYAIVTLNGQNIVNADNMFRFWQAEVKSLVKEKQNELIIHFRSPVKEILPKIEKLSHKLPAASDSAIGTSPYTRKAPYQYGWDWGPRLVTSGIWKPVRIEAWDTLKIADQHIVINNLNNNRAQLEIETEVFSDVSGKALLKISDDRNKFEIIRSIHLKPGTNMLKLECELVDPEIWWPSGYGEQPLYTFKTEISVGKEYDNLSKRIGLRTLEIKQDRDKWGESFTFVINGVPIFAKGANWIPADSFPTRVSEEKYHYLISSAVQSNMNMIRVWGGGIYESDIFYEICDELGILVWQDFMFSCALYPGDEKFLNSVREEAEYQVRRLRHHPCIALWCGNNEIEMGWRDWGFQENMPATMWEDYLRLFHKVLPDVCEKEDPNRKYWPSSPASDAISVIHPNDATHGDTHFWGVWHGQEPFHFYEKHFPRFISEYGFQSFPEPESIKQFTIKKDHDIFSPVMLIHQKNKQGNKIIKDYLEKYYIVPKDFNNFVLLSQLLQAEGIKIGAEHFRRLRPRCMGSLYWQLNDCWPVASWASIDYYGRLKALHYYAKRFYAPILISAYLENDVYKFYVVSDSSENLTASLQIRLMDFYGQVFSSCEKILQIRPHDSLVCHSISQSDIPSFADSKKTFLYCALSTEEKMITENAFYFELPKDLNLTKPQLNLDIKKKSSGFLVSFFSKSLVRSVILQADGIDGQFEDNFFDVYPGQTRTIYFINKSDSCEEDFKNALSYLTLFDLMEMKP